MSTPEPKEFVRITWAQLIVLLLFTGLLAAGVSSLFRRLDDAGAAKKVLPVPTEDTLRVQLIKFPDDYLTTRVDEVQTANRRLEDRLNKHLDKCGERRRTSSQYLDDDEDE